MPERVSDLDGLFGYSTEAQESGHEIWYVECKKSVQDRFAHECRKKATRKTKT
jgi:hypothetical protein